MVNNIDTAKRALVTLIKAIAVIYGLAAGLTRESTDVQVRAAFKKVSRKAHPDRGDLNFVSLQNSERQTTSLQKFISLQLAQMVA